MKITVVKNPQDFGYKKSNSLVTNLIMLFFGIIFLLGSNEFIQFIFIGAGCFILIYGISQFVWYSRQKTRYPNAFLSTGLGSILTGLFLILLSSVLQNAFNLIIGIWLIFLGVAKFSEAFLIKKATPIALVLPIVLLILGLYTIFNENAILMIIGILLILYSLYDLYIMVLKK